MPASISQARDQMSALFKGALDAANLSPAVVVIWDDTENVAKPPAPPTPWARFKVNHTTSRQTSLSGASGQIKYTRQGFAVVQLFTVSGQGQVAADQITAIILAAFEGVTTSGGLLFRNARANEIGQTGDWHQTNVLIDFEYDEYK